MRLKTFFLSIFVLFFIFFIIFYTLKTYTPDTENKNSIVKASDISIVQRQREESKQEPISLLFVGDIMLDRTIRKDGEQYGYPNLFSCLKEEFSRHDAVIGNLEGTITHFDSVSKDAPYQSPQSFRFTFDISAIKALREIGLSIVSIANNHIRDFGEEGIEQTIKYSENINLKTFGDPRINKQRYLLYNIKDTTFAFVSYNQFFGTKEQTLEDLKYVQSISDIQIIYAHWGEEYIPTPEKIKYLARDFVDHGADLIIGSHPHIIQEKEIYKDIHIYYSLGNFIFDQYWEESVRTGLTVAVQIKDKKISTTNEKLTLSSRHTGTCFK